MIYTHDIIRQQLYDKMKINEYSTRDPLKVKGDQRRMAAKLSEMVELALPRLEMGAIRYGADWDHESLMAYMQKKFDLYKGNREL